MKNHYRANKRLVGVVWALRLKFGKAYTINRSFFVVLGNHGEQRNLLCFFSSSHAQGLKRRAVTQTLNFLSKHR